MLDYKWLVLCLLAISGVLSPCRASAQVPSDVLDMAKAYAKGQPQSPGPGGRDVVDVYVRSFFDGFTRGGGASSAWSPVEQAAHEQGERRWQQGREAQERTFAGFGYTRVELSGTWTIWYETSAFDADHLGGNSWLSFLPGMRWDRRGGAEGSKPRTLRVLVVGYLSPPGRYGHLGVYGRELFAESIKVISE